MSAPVAAAAATPLRDSPRRSALAFSTAINDGDLDRAVDCFGWGGALVTPDATVVRGEAGIRAILAQVIERGTAVEVEASEATVTNGVAVVNEIWAIHTPGPDGADHLQRCAPQLVLRPGPEAWKLAIAAPWRPLESRPRS